MRASFLRTFLFGFALLVTGFAGPALVTAPASAGDDECYYSTYQSWHANYDSYCLRSITSVAVANVPVWVSFGYTSGTKAPKDLFIFGVGQAPKVEVAIGTKKLGMVTKEGAYKADNAMMNAVVTGLRQKKNLVLTVVPATGSKTSYTLPANGFEEAYQRMAK